MSIYATVSGHLKYKTKEHYLKAKDILEKGGWLEDMENHIEADDHDLTILFPLGSYRNLLRRLDDLIVGAWGYLEYACRDGMFVGGQFDGSQIVEVDLEKFAEEEGIAKPDKDKYADEDDYYDAVAYWEDDVMLAYMGD